MCPDWALGSGQQYSAVDWQRTSIRLIEDCWNHHPSCSCKFHEVLTFYFLGCLEAVLALWCWGHISISATDTSETGELLFDDIVIIAFALYFYDNSSCLWRANKVCDIPSLQSLWMKKRWGILPLIDDTDRKVICPHKFWPWLWDWWRLEPTSKPRFTWRMTIFKRVCILVLCFQTDVGIMM